MYSHGVVLRDRYTNHCRSKIQQVDSRTIFLLQVRVRVRAYTALLQGLQVREVCLYIVARTVIQLSTGFAGSIIPLLQLFFRFNRLYCHEYTSRTNINYLRAESWYAIGPLAPTRTNERTRYSLPNDDFSC